MDINKLNLEKFPINDQRINADILNEFSCRVDKIDNFLKNEALMQHDNYLSTTTIIYTAEKKEIVGFYTVQNSILKLEEINNNTNNIKRNNLSFNDIESFPTVHLAFFGIASDYQNKKIGMSILLELYENLTSVVKNISGFIALTVLSLDNSTEFYEKCGFSFMRTLNENDTSPKHMMINVDEMIGYTSNSVLKEAETVA